MQVIRNLVRCERGFPSDDIKHWEAFNLFLENKGINVICDIKGFHLREYLSSFEYDPLVYERARSSVFTLLKEISAPQLALLGRTTKLMDIK